MSETSTVSNETDGAVADVLDIRNDVCPYTFVRSKLALEELEAGQVLEIHLGNSESATNVPRSIALEDHEVLSVDKTGASHWVIRARKA